MATNKWTDEEIEFLKANYNTMTNKEIAQHINRTESAIQTKRRDMRLLFGDCRKYTFQDVINEFAKTDYELLSDESEYTNCGNPSIRYICPKHRNAGEQKISLSHLMNGRGCYYCGREKTESSKRLDIENDKEKYISLCKSKGFDFVDVVRKKGKIFIVFTIPDHPELGEQQMQYCNMKRVSIFNRFYMGKDYSEKYIMRNLNEVNPNIELLEPYTNFATPIKCICRKHNQTIIDSMQNILQGKGCEKCELERLSIDDFLSQEEAQDKIRDRNPHIKLIKYNGSIRNCKCYCEKHDKEFDRRFYNLISFDSGCDQCYDEYYIKDQETRANEFKEKLKKKHPELVVVGDYVTSQTPTNFFCSKHNYYYTCTPAAALERCSCCNKSSVNYKEGIVGQLLEEWGYKVERQKVFTECRDINPLPFDIYLPDFNVLIEYQGEQHYHAISFESSDESKRQEKLLYTQKHDRIKKEFCQNNKIPLICIPYWEFDNLEYYLFDNLVNYGVIEEQ